MTYAGATTRSRRSANRKPIAPLVAAALLCLAGFAQAQTAQAPEKEPGIFESVGRWFARGFDNMKNSFSGAKTNIDSLGNNAANAGKAIGDKAAEAGKNAADAMKKLPSTRVITGHERCTTAPNGAPDCRAAATSICQANGFAGGQSVDFVSAEKCPTAVWMQRRQPEPGECVTETFVTRAMCQ